jgi:hypothetical protein
MPDFWRHSPQLSYSSSANVATFPSHSRSAAAAPGDNLPDALPTDSELACGVQTGILDTPADEGPVAAKGLPERLGARFGFRCSGQHFTTLSSRSAPLAQWARYLGVPGAITPYPDDRGVRQ